MNLNECRNYVFVVCFCWKVLDLLRDFVGNCWKLCVFVLLVFFVVLYYYVE